MFFVVADGKPHLRIYANQNHDDIAKGNDFIAPQLIPETRKKISLIQDELGKARIYHEHGVGELSTIVDTNGNQKHIRVLSEDPPGFNFGKAELELTWGAKYIPGFRNGHAVECTFSQYVWFFPVSRRRISTLANLFRFTLEKTAHSACVSGHARFGIFFDSIGIDCRSRLVAGKRHARRARKQRAASDWAAEISPSVNRPRSKRVD